MNRFLSLLVLASLAACGGGGGGSAGASGALPLVASDSPAVGPAGHVPEPVASAPTPEKAPGCRVGLFGDSIMYGFGLSPRPVERLRSAKPGWTFVDHSISGDTWHDGVPRQMQNVQALDVAVLQWGINDAKVAFALEEVTMAERVMIMTAKNIGAKAVVTGLINNTLPLGDSYNAKIRETAIAAGAAFASWGERETSLRDGLHPDQAGSDALVDDLINTLEKECAR